MRILTIGGGPAGLAFAIEARLNNLDVIVIDRGRCIPIRGEVLSAEAKPALERLGVYSEIANNLSSFSGRRTRWGTEYARESSAICSPFGADHLLNRSAFEDTLRQRAAYLGADVRSNHVIAVLRKSNRWKIDLASGESVDCDFIVDASGRAMWLTRRLGVPPFSADQLVAASLYIKRLEPRMFFSVDSVPGGWWFRTPLTGEREVMILMTDADCIPSDLAGAARLSGLGEVIEPMPGPIRSARTLCAGSVAGLNWATVGDAALSQDPLSGRGVSFALESAHNLAMALLQSANGNGCLSKYAQFLQAATLRHFLRRSQSYRIERRWQHAQFWRRRHSTTPEFRGREL
jgi:flavin-dependent dehydrogenase